MKKLKAGKETPINRAVRLYVAHSTKWNRAVNLKRPKSIISKRREATYRAFDRVMALVGKYSHVKKP